MWTDRYIGLPFRADGRDRDGLDCWGLVRLVYVERFGIVLPGYTGLFTGLDRQSLVRVAEAMEAGRAAWRARPAPEDGDVVLLAKVVGGVGVHVGLWVAPDRLLHALPGPGTVLEAYSSSAWARRTIGYYHHDR